MAPLATLVIFITMRLFARLLAPPTGLVIPRATLSVDEHENAPVFAAADWQQVANALVWVAFSEQKL